MKKKTTEKKHRIASWLMALGIGVGAAAGVGGAVACAPANTTVPDNQQTYTQQIEDLQNQIEDLQQQLSDLQDARGNQAQALQSQINKLQLQQAYASTFANYVCLDLTTVNGNTVDNSSVFYAPNGEFTFSSTHAYLASNDGLLFFKNGNEEKVIPTSNNNIISDYAKLIKEQIASADVVTQSASDVTLYTSYTCTSAKNNLSLIFNLNDDGTFNNATFNQNEIIFDQGSKAEYENENNANGAKIKAYNQYLSMVDGMNELAKNPYIIIDSTSDYGDFTSGGQYALSNNAVVYKSTDGTSPQYVVSDASGYRQLGDGELTETNNYVTKKSMFEELKSMLKDDEINSMTLNYDKSNNVYTFELNRIYNNKMVLTFKFEDGGMSFVEKYTASNSNIHSYVTTNRIKQATIQQFNEIYNEANDAIENFISAQNGLNR